MTDEYDAEIPPDRASPSSRRSLAPVSAPGDLEPLVDELARVFNDADEARLVAQRAGVPPAAIPAFDLPQVFWHRVIKAAEDGKVPGGAGAIAGAAIKLYPDNPVFRRWARRASPRPDRPKILRVAVLVGLAATASAVAAWQCWPPPPSLTNPAEPIATNAATTPTELHDPPTSDGAAVPPTHSTSGSPDLTPTASTTSGDPSAPPPDTTKKPRPKQPALPPDTTPTAPTPSAPTADPRRWKVLDVATNAERFVGKRLTLDAHAPAGTILTVATRCDPPTTSTAGPRCLVREDPDDPAGHHCFTRDSIPRDASLCIHPRGIEADSK